MKIELKVKKEFDVRKLQVDVHVRYWEDGQINGVEDKEGNMPFAEGENWRPLIDLETGKIEEWPADIEAKIHYKVCDEGVYVLQDKRGITVKKLEGYVPDIMCPNGGGYGDYIIMNIAKGGEIEGWVCDLKEFKN